MSHFLDDAWASAFHVAPDEPRSPPGVPGRSTLTSRLPPSPHAIARALAAELRGSAPPAGGGTAAVQASGALDGPDIHQVAAAGVASGGGPLPFLDEIRRAFGHHDVDGVRAHVGGAADQAAAALGARAYATGDAVAFRGAPDLHLAAHEAAHVVQQRGGVQLAGDVGQAGDVYEQHADAVADRVVRGQSAESLLDAMAPGGGTVAVQRAVQLNEEDPLREHTFTIPIEAVPADYAGLREQVEAAVARQVQSRTEVAQPDGGRAPARRERTLVGASNLESLHPAMQPGQRVELTARLIPSANGARYEQIVFTMPRQPERGPAPAEGPRQSERPGLARLAPPGYRPPGQIANREARLEQVRDLLDERLHGRGLDCDPEALWTPTASCVLRMMPAMPNMMGHDGISGTDVPRRNVERTEPGWQGMPGSHAETVRVLMQMLGARDYRERTAGAEDMSNPQLASVVDAFLAAGRQAKARRDQRLQQYAVVAAGDGGGSMISAELQRYSAAERVLFDGDPTCLWRYL